MRGSHTNRNRMPNITARKHITNTSAGGFEPRGERELRLHLIGAADHQAVGEVDARGADPEAYLVLLEVRALGLFEPQHIGSAPFPATDRLHFLLLAIRPSLVPTISQNDRERSVDRRPAPASTAVTGDVAWNSNDGDPTRPA